MSRGTCSRLFEAEAMRDGRLTGAERASYERHVAGCAECAREVRALENLVAALRASDEDDEGADELRVRRERTRLLAAFDGALVAPQRRGARRWLVGTAAVATGAVCVAVLLVLWRARSPAWSGQIPSAVVHAEGVAVWSERKEGDRDEVLLERGVLWIHVDHASGERPVRVVLPDGELEDVGTTFTVSAEDGRTRRVTVDEGRVLLRLRGRPAVTVASGETWVADVPAPVACASTAPSTAPSAASAVPMSVPVPDAATDFRAAMSALDDGDDRGAATMFASFLQRHPRDSRAEDAAYLRVIALQRCGESAAMKEAASTYLHVYPAGFRRAEVERLARQ